MEQLSKNQIQLYNIKEEEDGQRIDNLLIKLLKGVPKSYIYKIIRNGEVRVNKKRVTVSYKLNIMDIVRIPPVRTASKANDAPQKFIPQKAFEVLFEDEYFLIINKPSGTASHGGSGVSFGVIEQLRITLPELKYLELAHRLDKETSGALILAKKRKSLLAIQEIIKQHRMYKSYLALACGVLNKTTITVKDPLFKYLTANGERRVRIDHEQGNTAQTIFKIKSKYSKFTLLQAILKTGRTHQIRVHLQGLGTPIAGDSKYGDFELNKQLFKLGLKRMFLHAHELRFTHPFTEQEIKISVPLPEELNTFLKAL